MNLFRSLVRVWRRKTELAEELESHLRMAIADRVARGESAEDARREVMREFGSVPLIADVTRERWGWIWVEDFLQDVRYGFRTLLKQRSFTFVTVLTLALGIGACTAIFSLVNAVLLRSLPYGAPERLVYLYTPNSHFKIPIEAIPPSNADFFDLQRTSHSFEAMTLFEQKRYDLAVDDQPQRVGGATVDANFFKTLRSSPELGRVTQEGDESGGDNRVVVLSHGLWQSVFGGRADALGSTLRLNGSPYRVIGIMPPGFGYPNKNDLPFGDGHIEMTQLWLPSALTPQQKLNREGSNGNTVTLARLKPGVTLREAQAEMSTIMSRLDTLHDAVMRGWGAYIESFLDSALGPVRPLMWLLTGAVGFVLLIACGNAANLLLARAANRTHELGMRATLGARRGRLLRQMLTESLMLSSAAGIAGIVLAWVFLHAMLRLNPGNIPRMKEATLDLRVMAFLIFVTLLTGLLFGMLPSFSASRIHLTEFLKSGGMRGIAGGRKRLRNSLVVVQVALVVMLLTGAGLLVRSYAKVLTIQTGFSASSLSAHLQQGPRYDTRDKRLSLVRVLLGKIQAVHSVEAAGVVSHLPLSNSESVSTVWVEGYPNQKDQLAETRDITADYLSAMRTPLLDGRSFTEDDDARGARVVIVNEAFAKKYLGGKDVVGRHLRITTSGPWSTVIGLAADVRNEDLEVAAIPQIYFPLGQGDVHRLYLAVRSSLPQDALVSAVRAAVRDIDPSISVEDVHAMGELVSQASARRRFQTTLLTVFSGIAMFLAVVGVYGLLAYSVRQSTGEIGIRMALGSSKGGVVGLVLREGLGLLGVGLVIGLVGAFGCTRLLNGFLYGVPALDPVTFVLVPVLLLVAVLGACLVPSFRAAAVDPMQALRHE